MAGVAALVLSVNPNLTGVQVQEILKQSAYDLGLAGWDPSYGWGRVNAAGAVSTALDYIGARDTSPPTINILSPLDGEVLTKKSVQVIVDARDNVGVTLVELYVDGKLSGTSSTAPFSIGLNTRKLSSGSHTLQCIAYDAAGNRGISQPISVIR